MPVKVKCSGCQAVLNAPSAARGKAIKCPKCGKAVRVPAGSSTPGTTKKPAGAKPAPAADDDDFLSTLDLSRVEDRKSRVCPRCGNIVGAEDTDCPACGADVDTGGLGTAQRLRKGRKGAAPSEFTQKAPAEGGRFVAKQQGLIWKTVLIFTIFANVAMLAVFMMLWVYNIPPLMFWGFISTVVLLVVPGWVWSMQGQIVQRMLNPRDEHRPLRFEPTTSMALGVKTLIWSLAFGAPIWLLLGVPGAWMVSSENPTGWILLGIAAGAFLALAAVCWPVVQAHMAMPITLPGWQVHKVLADVGKNLVPSLAWAGLAFGTFLPVAAVIGGCGYWAWNDYETLSNQFQASAAYDQTLAASELDKTVPKPEGDAPEIEWSRMLIPSLVWLLVSVPAAFWVVFNTRTAGLFVKLFKLNLSLTAEERQYVYKARTAEERERDAKSRQGTQTIYVAAFLAAALGAAAGMIYKTFADGVGFLEGIGLGLLGAGALYLLVSLGQLAAGMKVPEKRTGLIIGVVLAVLVTGLGGVLWMVGSAEPAPAAAPAQPA